MFSDLKKCYTNFKISYELYRSIVKEMNISFTKLGHEECEKCESFLLHDPNHNKENASVNKDCSNCFQWLQYIKKVEETREEYRVDKQEKNNEENIFYTTDMQKVIMLPRIDMDHSL